MEAKRLMFLGTASSVGKSTLATAFCRYYKRKGYNVAPFKALNISLNSFVTKEGDEIGRAQVVQAEACEIEPKEYMNPILMKPSANNKTQVIVRGKVYCTMDGYKYKDLNKYLKGVAKEAFDHISKDYDFIVLEGSGSCAEINLRETDIANIEMAKVSNSPVILVADIDGGGVFASIVGTIMLLPPEERALIKGVIINKFRGKKEFFKPAMKQVEELINIPVLGVMPYFELNIEDEDGVTEKISNKKGKGIDVVVIRLPHMSNFTDFNVLRAMNGINIRYINSPKEIENAKMIIIPGSKNTIEDLNFIKETGFREIILEKAKSDTIIFGICGGYQILGKEIKDPLGVEGSPREVKGLGLLDLATTFNGKKKTRQVKAKNNEGLVVRGYEIHNGVSECLDDKSIWIQGEAGEVLGMKSRNVYGTYLHGIFEEEDFAYTFINKYVSQLECHEKVSYKEYKMNEYDKLCDILEENIDMDLVNSIINGK